MRQKLESWLLDNWYSTNTPPNVVLRLLEPAYRMAAALRRRLIKPGKLRRPVIVIGNLTTGGSGKTPLVIALCHLLLQNGVKPGVISRGYRRSHHGNRRLTDGDNAATVGDEPLLIARRTGAPVAVANKRLEAAALLDDEQIDVLIADDGLQHYRLPRAVEICVIDGQRRFGNGHLLPAGPLREPLARLEAVDFRVCNGGQPGNGEYLMRLRADVLCSLDDSRKVNLDEWRGRAVDAIAAISNPQRFFALLRDAGMEVHEKVFPDHHAYRQQDFAPARERPLIMTEKDAIKCAGFALKEAWYLPVDAELPDEFKTAILLKVDNMLRHGKAE